MTIKRYTPTPLFRLAAVVLVLGVALLALEAWRRLDPLLLVFVAGTAVVAFFMLLGALAYAECDGKTLIYRTPLRGTYRIDRDQIERVEMGGRRWRALIIGYHPRETDGRIASERVRFLNLAPLQGQAELYELLGGAPDDGD